MLRNFAFFLLREVHTVLLNEVLSLNAQDLPIEVFNPAISCFLNEVLSLNAQESAEHVIATAGDESSMKS